VPGQATTESDPQGNNFGHGFTGRSGGRTPVWINETVDLSEYAGQEILLRFAYVTDEAYSEPGMVIDDIAIPEIEWSDDVEGGEEDWTTEGWVRSHNRVPQQWLVRVVLIGSNGQTTIQDVEVVDGIGTLDIDFSQMESALVFISGLTRFTNQSSAYHLVVE
jgi:hypothetical protein